MYRKLVDWRRCLNEIWWTKKNQLRERKFKEKYKNGMKFVSKTQNRRNVDKRNGKRKGVEEERL